MRFLQTETTLAMLDCDPCYPHAAGFIDPHDGMVRSKSIFFYAILYWVGVILVAFPIAPTSVGPLRTALGIIVGCEVASTA